ncbi:hypothetical protein IAT38_008424 [Cryptococcus sp. DSM 104549]
MPQLTLSTKPNSRSLALSSSPAQPTKQSPSKRGGKQPDLLDLHHKEENMVASRRAKKEEDAGEGKKDEPRGTKRSSPEGGGAAEPKSKKHKNAYEIKGRIATVEDSSRADEDPPLNQLLALTEKLEKEGKKVEKGESVVYWMRMEDVRVEDNTALYKASQLAQELKLPLVVLFVLSPGDYDWHDRSPRRIDFVLRNLRSVQAKLQELNIPLTIKSYPKRLSIPRHIITDILPSLSATHLFANIEYEVDELRRDVKVVQLGYEKGVEVKLFHDRLAVPPGKVLSKAGKPMSVYSPWQRAWAKILDDEPHLLDQSPLPHANDKAVREHQALDKLFDEKVPESVPGFECKDKETMEELWPEGTDTAMQILDRFLHTKARKHHFEITSPLDPGAERSDKQSRIQTYATGRNLVDGDNSSKLSPYLASGVISARMVLNEAKKMGKRGKDKLESGRDTGVGMWVQEVAWRDFYNQVMATWPRVSMGRPFLEKFADVQWETSETNLQAWKDGKTGYPIVDAAMRACKARGWMENRVRMVAACFLVKDLMLDWRLGEKHFMESFIDGDLAANNGGWQWTASTGTDPQPYFRIFNTITQSEKCDPNGDYIRYWVPELKNLKGKVIHDPFHNMPSAEFKKLGYPQPIVDHKKARERALYRYKNVGEVEYE